MADPKGFLKNTERELPARRPVPIRLLDWKEVYEPGNPEVLHRQSGRCMDCGVPFCHQGCPLGNLIPEWNDLVWRDDFAAAIERLHATNNFPEFTGRLCPAPCESACVLGINQPAVTIKQVEVSIIDRAFDEGWVTPQIPERLTGKTVAVVGSGPAGLAAAQQLTRAGHTVAVYERDDAIGGLLRYGIPDFKMEKHQIDRRIAQMEAEGTRFRPSTNVGTDVSWADLQERYDAVVVATGALKPRDLALPGRALSGVHYAMDYLTPANKSVAGHNPVDLIDVQGKHVVILGGGDTGADCIGTAHRQGAASVTTLAIGRKPATERGENTPWPTDPHLFEVASAHEEGGARVYTVSTVEYLGDENGKLRALKVAETDFIDGQRIPKAGTEREIPADYVFLALGFVGNDNDSVQEQTDLAWTSRGTLDRSANYATNIPGVFVAGDAGRGASLIVWAIAEGRGAAAAVDTYLEGTTILPQPVRASDRPFSA